MDDPRASRLLLRPKFTRHNYEFARALDKAWQQGGWTVYVDELYYIDGELKLSKPLNRLLTQGRDPGRITVVCGMQRPTNVTRFAIGEASHVISFSVEGRDVTILRDIAGARFSRLVEELGPKEFAWMDRGDNQKRIWIGRLDRETKTEFEGDYV